jgi:hypothetical protein
LKISRFSANIWRLFSTCTSSFQAAVAASCTKDWVATPMEGRSFSRAAMSSASPAIIAER